MRAAKASGGDWHHLRAQQQLGATAVGPQSRSKKDDCLANAPPCFIANRLLNGTAPETCPLDPSTMAWVSANMPTHCDDLELLAQKQNLLATSAAGLFTGCPSAEKLFTRASRYRSKRVHYQQGLYKNPRTKKDDAAVQEIATTSGNWRGWRRAEPAAAMQRRRRQQGPSRSLRSKPRQRLGSRSNPPSAVHARCPWREMQSERQRAKQ